MTLEMRGRNRVSAAAHSRLHRAATRFGRVLVVVLAAFVGLASPGPAHAQAGPAPVAVEDLPPDAAAVLGASVRLIRAAGASADTFPVTFGAPARAALSEPGFAYEGFAVERIVITAYGASANGAVLEAVIGLSDRLRRRATLSLVAEYGATGDGYAVHRASVYPLVPDPPRVFQYIVPAAAAVPAGPATFESLLRYADANALRLGGPNDVPAGAQDYFVFSFFMDRLSPDTETAGVTGLDAVSLDGDVTEARLLDDQGFRVHVQQVNLALNAGAELFFKALYAPAGGAPLVAAALSSHPFPDAVSAAPGAAPGETRRSLPNLLPEE